MLINAQNTRAIAVLPMAGRVLHHLVVVAFHTGNAYGVISGYILAANTFVIGAEYLPLEQFCSAAPRLYTVKASIEVTTTCSTLILMALYLKSRRFALHRYITDSAYKRIFDTQLPPLTMRANSKVRAFMIDAMGHRTKEVYAYAIRHRGRVFPWQGVRSLSQRYTPSPQEYFPDAKGNKIKIPGGLNKLSINPDDPGAFHLHKNDGTLEQYAREMCAEVWDDKKLSWENPQDKDNHYWDCEVMTLALAFVKAAAGWTAFSMPTASRP